MAKIGTRARARRGNRLRVLTALLAAAALLGANVGGAAAQLEGDTYANEEFDWSVSWDADVWEAEEGASSDAYELQLTSENSLAFFSSGEDYEGDPAACIEAVIDGFTSTDGIEDVEPLEDDGAAGEDDGFAFATYTYSAETSGGETVDGVYYLQCQTLVEDEAVLLAEHVAPTSVYDAAAELFAEVLDNLDTPEIGGADADDEATPEDEETPGAGAGVDGNTYTSPTFGYTVEWDEDDWTVDDETEGVPGRDTLILDYNDGGFLYVEGYEDFDGDPAECLDASSSEFLENDQVDESMPLEDDDGEPVEGEEDGVAFAAYTLTTGGDELNAYFDCRTLVEDEAVLAFSLVAPPQVYDDALAAVEDIADSLQLEGADATEDDATPRADEEEETPAADEEDATPAAGGEDEETPEADDAAGVDGNAYVSPTYGYELTWDADVWEVVEATSEDDLDTLVLTDGTAEATLTGVEDFEGDAEACFEGAEETIADRDGVEDVAVAEDDDGDPVRDASADGSNVYGVYLYTLDGEDTAEYVDCFTLEEGTSVVYLSSVFPSDEIDELSAAIDLISALTLPEAEPVN